MHMAGRTRKVFTTVFACVAMLPAVGRLFAYPALNFYVECSANVLAGIGLGMMIVSWAELFTPYWQKTVGGYIAFAFGGGAILGMFMSSMDPFYQAAAQIGACAVSFALLAVCYPRSELGNAAKQPIPKHWVMPIGIELITLAYSISFGLLFSLLFDHAAVAVDAPFVCLAILLGTCLYGFVVAFFKKYIPFSFLQKIILPFHFALAFMHAVCDRALAAYPCSCDDRDMHPCILRSGKPLLACGNDHQLCRPPSLYCSSR